LWGVARGLYIKAQEFIEYLPKYLQHEHGDAVF